MILQRPVFWRQGTLLEPQHFQILDYQRHADLAFLAAAFHPYPWGFFDLEVDREALANFTFQPLRLDLWLPDGRRLALPGNLQVAPRSFAKAWTNTDEPLVVWLAVPIFSATAPNVNPVGETAAPGASGRRLYNSQAEPQMVPDLMGDGPASRVDLLHYNASILFGSEATIPLEGVSAVPMARLQRDGERVLARGDYAPPAIRLYGENPVRQLMADTLEILKAKGRQLEEYKLGPAQGQLESAGGAALTLITVLGVVCRYIARIHYLWAPPAVHPYSAFAALRELAAELTIFAPGLTALGESLSGQGAGLRPYDHLDPYPAFQETKIMIARLLDSVSLGPEIVVVFRRDGRRFVADLPPALTAGFACWLSVRSSLARESLTESLTAFGKLASPERVESLVAYNLPGLALTPMAIPPLGLPRNPDTVYFSLRQGDPMWEEAIKTHGLALFWDRAPEGAVITLAGNRV
jgi:type VI secretion system protein ImpJ